MNADPFSSRPAIRSRHLHAWALSLSVHALALACAFTLFASVHLAPQPEPFRWTVSLVEGTAVLPERPDTPQPSEPVPASPSTFASTDPVTKPAVEQRLVARSQPTRVVQQVTPVDHAAITRPAPQHVIEPQVMHPTRETAPKVIEQAPVQRPVRSITQPVPAPSSIVGPSVVTKAPAVTEPVPHPAPEATTSSASQAVAATQPDEPVQPKVVEQPALSRPAVVETPQPVPAPVPQEVASVPQAIVPEPTPPSPAMGRAPAQSVEPAQTSPEPLPAPVPATSAGLSSPKPDYGWLADALWKRIEKLKQYPQQARLNRLEGRVVLRVVITDDGSLQELAVAKSSGHPVLDEDALEVLRRAAPLTLVRPLGKSRVVVQVPISYRLDH